MRIETLATLVGVLTCLNVGLEARGYYRAQTAPPPRHEVARDQCQGSALLNYLLHNNNDVLTRHDPYIFKDLLDVRPGQTLADVGCGTGYHTLAACSWVGAKGKVYAVDVDPEAVAYVSSRARALGFSNVTPVVSRQTDLGLPPKSVDRLLFINVFHCLLNGATEKDPELRQKLVLPLLGSIYRALRPGGRVLAFDQAPEVMHDAGGVSPSVVLELMRQAGFRSAQLQNTGGTYVVVVEKP